jgi:hypothetical protein
MAAKCQNIFAIYTVTQESYDIIMNALLKLKAEATASPEAAKKFWEDSGLGDILESLPDIRKKRKSAGSKNKRSKRAKPLH